jgi:hypothetical protein
MTQAPQSHPLCFRVLLFATMLLQFTMTQPAHSQDEGQDKGKAPSKAAQDKIEKKMTDTPSGQVLVFSGGGAAKESKTINNKDLAGYNSLSDFLKSNDSPIANCKHPVPTPPPPCIICESGEIVCATAFRQNPPQPDDQPRQRNPPRSAKAPEEDKPQ